MGLNFLRRGGAGKEGAGAPLGAEDFVGKKAGLLPSKLGLHGQDGVLHDPLESVVAMYSGMCGRDLGKLTSMLDQHFGVAPEDQKKINDKVEVGRRVRASWGITDDGI